MQSRGTWWIRGGILAVSFITMFWLSFGISHAFPSPDERANAFFAQTFAESLTFCFEEPLNDFARGLIHPRSTVAPGTCILPSSFLGFPVLLSVVIMIFGIFGSGIGFFSSYAVTPILAILGIAAWWFFVRRVTKNERIADIAAFFVIIHPAFWYYSARVMMHNVPFVSLLMVACAVIVLAIDRRSSWIAFIAGVITAIAFTMRLSELPLFFVLACLLLFVYRRQVPWKFFAIGILGVVGVFMGYLVLNASVYGSLFATGYTLPDMRATSDVVIAAPSIISRILAYILPFGFHPRAVVKNVLFYGFQLYPLLTIFSILGAIFAWKTKQFGWRLFAGMLFFASCWMAVVYGSWAITDNIDPTVVTVGNSYVRYWLPLFVGSGVFFGFLLDRIAEHSRVGRIVVVGILIGITFTSARTVFGGSDGLLATRSALISSESKREMILEETHCDNEGKDRPIIIVDHADKYLFPTCRVIVPLRSESTYGILPELIDVVSVYYFGLTLPEKDMQYLNEEKLKSMGLRIDYIDTMFDESLYQFSRISVGEPL